MPHRPAQPCVRAAVTLAVCGLLAGASPGSASAQNPTHGPLTYEEGSPLHRISYTTMMEDASVTGRGAWSADVWFGFSNIFEQDSAATHVLFMDMERLVSTVTLRWGATDRLEEGYGKATSQ